MDRFEVLPSIMWRVESFWGGGDKKFRQSVSFLGMNWKLKILCLPEVGGVRVKVVLKRVGPATLSHDANFTVETCVLSHYSGDQFFKQTLATNLQFREWGIWSQFKADIERQEYVNYRSGLMFLIVVTPGDKWSALLQPHAYRKQPDPGEPNPCMQALTRDLGSILDSDVHSDVVLECGGREFRAHRAILSARSEVFEAMFRSDMLESREGKVRVVDASPEVLEQFLLYLYTGDVPKMGPDDARRLYAVADKYAVDSLKIKCAAVVTESYRSGVETKIPRSAPNTVVYLTAQEKTDLRTKELTRDVLLTREWKTLSQEFPRLTADMFRPLMEVAPEPPPEAPSESPKQEEASASSSDVKQ